MVTMITNVDRRRKKSVSSEHVIDELAPSRKEKILALVSRISSFAAMMHRRILNLVSQIPERAVLNGAGPSRWAR